ncbi:MAG: exonuclease domain-containing protein [Planctomycetota bacterium]
MFTDPSVAQAFLDFIGDDGQLIAHNGKGFDLPFLNAELAAAGLRTLDAGASIDTLHMARRKFPGSPASLDALCSRFGIDTKERERDGHGALLDSKLLAEVYIELTGGAQAGLDFNDEEEGDFRAADGDVKARRRPTPLAPRVSAEEAAAHAAFVEELGPDCLWAKR